MTQPKQTLRRRFGLRTWDVVLFWMGFFVTTVGITNIPGVEQGESISDGGVLVWLVSVAAWVTVFFRRSHPWATAGAGLLLAIAGSEYLLLLIGVLHLLLATSGRRRMVVGASSAGIVIAFWLREALLPWGSDVLAFSDGGSTLVFEAVIAVVSLGVTYGAATLVTSRRTAAAATGFAQAEHARASDLGDQVAQQSVREDVARELHDGLTNRLALLAMMGSNVEKAVDASDPRAPEFARQLKSQTHAALGDLRGFLQGLRESPAQPPAPRGTMREIGKLIGDAQQAGATIHATVLLEGMAEVTPTLDAAVHRMVQESITNALKHAPGAAISVFLEASPTAGVRMRVSNPLMPSADPAAGRGSGAGVVGIRERAKGLHGTAWIGAHEGEFIVDVTAPWTAEQVSGGTDTVSA